MDLFEDGSTGDCRWFYFVLHLFAQRCRALSEFVSPQKFPWRRDVKALTIPETAYGWRDSQPPRTPNDFLAMISGDYDAEEALIAKKSCCRARVNGSIICR